MKKYLCRVLKRLGRVMITDQLELQDLRRELQRIATHSTAEYIRMNMRNIQSVSDVLSVHNRAIELVSLEGLCLEFGVFFGNTINHIASRRGWIVDGFDSFEGLPDSWRDGFDKGHFKLGILPRVRNNVRLHKGWFENTIPDFLLTYDQDNLPISYLHVDSDLYTSAKTIFDLLGKKIVSGTIIVFDEYFNYDGWENGEFCAFQEFVNQRSLRYEYITYNFTHEQVAVLIK